MRAQDCMEVMKLNLHLSILMEHQFNASVDHKFQKTSPHIIFERSGILYTQMGAIETHYYNVSCEANQCTLQFTQETEKKNIFLHTKSTACGDEIGWDFIQSVMKTKISLIWVFTSIFSIL